MRIIAPKIEVPVMDMTPMIDVVFQLITFFMLVINFEQTEADERVKLPRDALARPQRFELRLQPGEGIRPARIAGAVREEDDCASRHAAIIAESR